MLRQRSDKGFTIVELMIMVVIIAILVALVMVTYGGIEVKKRDNERREDIKLLHSRLEAYQAQYGKYPTLENVNDSTWRATNMKGIEAASFQDPKAKDGKLVASPKANAYAYTPSPANCDNGANGDCTQYNLTASLEGGGTYSKQSLN